MYCHGNSRLAGNATSGEIVGMSVCVKFTRYAAIGVRVTSKRSSANLAIKRLVRHGVLREAADPYLVKRRPSRSRGQ